MRSQITVWIVRGKWVGHTDVPSEVRTATKKGKAEGVVEY